MLGIPFLDDLVTKWFRPQQFDDPVDRLNYFVTATILGFFAIMVSAKQYVGSPIQCFVPNEFRGGWEEYTEDICFIQNTYYVPFDASIPDDTVERRKMEFGYYPWVPVVLALQAVMFYLPNWLWKTLHQQSGVDLNTAVCDAAKLRAMRSNERRTEVAKLCTYIEESLEMYEAQRIPRRILCFRVGQNLGSYVTMLYIFIKFLYLVNIVTQFYMLNKFLSTDFTFWGIETMVHLYNGIDWEVTSVFPRVTMCDFTVRRLGNLHKHTVQCVLMINMFNEKIYLFIWFWFAFVLVSTVINFIYTFFALIPPSARERSIRTLLKQGALTQLTEQPDTKHVIRRFANNALCPDGVLLLRFIEGHAGGIIARDVAATLFGDYVHSLDMTYPVLPPPDTKSTSPGTDEYSEYPGKPGQTAYSSPPHFAEEKQRLMEPDSGLPKHKHI